MKYCQRCLYSTSHPFGLVLDGNGVCSGCRIHEEKDALDWAERYEKLEKIIQPYRSHSKNIHDCIVPISGGRDSYFILDFVKNILQLNPLLVNYNPHYNTRLGIRNLAYLRSLVGADFIQKTVSPKKVKKITLETLRLRGSVYWHVIAGQTSMPVQTAVAYKIPLIIWGAHQGLDQVGMFSHLDEVEMTRKYRKEHDLMGLEAEDLLDLSADLSIADLEPFLYPSDMELDAIGVRGLYLGNYVRWDTKTQHEKMIAKYGYETSRQQRTFDTYSDVDSFHYSGIHDYIKFIKCGYGKVLDHACREIRFGRLSRCQGLSLVKFYQDVVPSDTKLLTSWLGLEERDFFDSVWAHRSSVHWKKTRDGDFRLKESVLEHAKTESVNQSVSGSLENCQFQISKSRDPYAKEDRYILLDRGWVD